MLKEDKHMALTNTIKQIGKKTAASLYNVSENGAKQIKEFKFDFTDLDDYNSIDITQSEKFKSLFDDIKQITGPAIYIFEILSDHSPSIIVSALNAYSATEDAKAVPAIKKNISESKILYIGKVKRNMWGRLVQHLGFYPIRLTQGLQFFYWAKGISLSAKLTILEFEPEMANLMGVIEGELAAQLKPILGKHKQ